MASKKRRRQPKGSISASVAFRRLEQALTVNAGLESEVKLLRSLALHVKHRDYANADKLYGEWRERYAGGRVPTKRVYPADYKYHVVKHYTEALPGDKQRVCEYYRLPQELVIKWVAAHRKDGMKGLDGRGEGILTPSLRWRKLDEAAPTNNVKEPFPTKIKDKTGHIYLPKSRWEIL